MSRAGCLRLGDWTLGKERVCAYFDLEIVLLRFVQVNRGVGVRAFHGLHRAGSGLEGRLFATLKIVLKR